MVLYLMLISSSQVIHCDIRVDPNIGLSTEVKKKDNKNLPCLLCLQDSLWENTANGIVKVKGKMETFKSRKNASTVEQVKEKSIAFRKFCITEMIGLINDVISID